MPDQITRKYFQLLVDAASNHFGGEAGKATYASGGNVTVTFGTQRGSIVNAYQVLDRLVNEGFFPETQKQGANLDDAMYNINNKKFLNPYDGVTVGVNEAGNVFLMLENFGANLKPEGIVITETASSMVALV